VYGKRSSLQKDESIEYLNESFVVGEDFRFENGMTLELRVDVGQVEEGLVESDVKLLLHPEHKGVVSEYTINVVRMSNECLTNLVHNVFLNVLRMSCKFLMNFRQMSLQTSY
jgi:hypothetical protein